MKEALAPEQNTAQVTPEEIAAAMKALEVEAPPAEEASIEEVAEALRMIDEPAFGEGKEEKAIRDGERIDQLKKELDNIPPDEEDPKVGYGGGGGGGKGGLWGETKYRQCEVCHGTRKKWFFLNCPNCRGTGTVPKSRKGGIITPDMQYITTDSEDNL